MISTAAIEIAELEHFYGERRALAGLSLRIEPGEIFVFLGPNGGGKTTLFRLLSTLLPIQRGRVSVLGFDLQTQMQAVRQRLGVVFQAPSLDKKLSVAENLMHQGHLYGLSGRRLRERQDEMLGRLALTDRRNEMVEKLSGGLRRRVELAKGMLHHPRLLLLDEPSTGLDPGARSDLWDYLEQIRREDGVTVVLTTHLLEEADKADRIAILNEGSLVALDTPEALRATVGGDSITIQTEDPEAMVRGIESRFGCVAGVVSGSVRLEQADGHQWIARLVEAFPGQIQAITLGKPTLEDVFIERTGHRFWREREEVSVG
ncbi:MAG TPA: ATP-binding cassette domain-containing protein [Pirellulales bacterium]|jgi:ABC-2 type transport system ATP-binding protein|nr:ATP-binding cassette domain-containing protein [Pirellulales bacterium]